VDKERERVYCAMHVGMERNVRFAGCGIALPRPRKCRRATCQCAPPSCQLATKNIIMSDSSRPSSPVSRSSAVAVPPGAQVRRRATGSQAAKPNSSRAAGAGGSSSTMMRLYTDDSPGLRVDPLIVIFLSIAFIASIFFLHISARIIKSFSK